MHSFSTLYIVLAAAVGVSADLSVNNWYANLDYMPTSC